MKNLVVVLFILLFVSCATYDNVVVRTHANVMDDLCSENDKKSMLVKLGPCNRKISDGDGGEILIWEEKFTSYRSSSHFNWLTKSTYYKTTPNVKEYSISLYYDKNGRCYTWNTKGHDLKVVKRVEKEKKHKESSLYNQYWIGVAVIAAYLSFNFLF